MPPRYRRLSLRFAFVGGLSLAATGCSGWENTALNEAAHAQPQQGVEIDVEEARIMTHKVITKTFFYRDGPQQSRAPDGELDVGTEVRVHDTLGSYVRVELPSGDEAYVSTAALKVLEEAEE